MSAGLSALAAIIDPAADAAYRHQVARESYRLGWSDGFDAGAAAMAAQYKAGLLGIYYDAQLQAARLHVCCRSCRRRGHRDGCTRCEDRTPETYGQPHPDDYAGAAP